MITDSQLNGYSERFLNFVNSSSESNVITLQVIASMVRSDHMIQLFLSKLNLYDIVRVIYYTYFLSKGYKQDDIFILLDKIYIYTINDYDDKEYIDLECSECYGDGYVECDRCDGSGNDECRHCDGEGSVDCDSCGGEGTEECGYCDGEGSETEEDDEGDEVEVECVHCDGKGTERCGNCNGSRNFECSSCNGSGNESCYHCEGSGSEGCESCDGAGQVQSDEEYYIDISISYNVTLDSSILRFEDKPMENDDFENDVEYNFYLKFIRTQKDVLVSDIDSEYDTDDWDRVVVVSDVIELTDSNSENFRDAKFF